MNKNIIIAVFVLLLVSLVATLMLLTTNNTGLYMKEENKNTSVPKQDAQNLIASEIKTELIKKHGESAEELDITVAEVSGDYAKGGASEIGMGGGMWFAAKVNNKWELVWDGNGIITCEDLKDYPEFPSSMIPQCYNTVSEEMIDR